MVENRIQIERGKSAVFSIIVMDKSTGEPYELQQGEVLRFGVKNCSDDDAYLILKELSSSDADEDGGYSLHILPSDTISLRAGDQYHYDIGLQSGNDYWPVIGYTDFIITPNVTRMGQ